MDIKLLPLYFVVGGVVVAAVSYLGGQGKSNVAAFIGMLPAVTVITMVAIYLSGGTPLTVSYAKGLLKLLPAWILYIVCLVFLLPRIGLTGSMLVGIAAYVAASALIIKLW
ncbi:MAG: DUF3147 domain-containing protein [Chloroflexota bacterium]